MPKLPRWRRILEESRRQALVAIEFYNRPGDRRSYSDFIIHQHLAWLNLLLASRIKENNQVFYIQNRKYVKNPDGSRKTWDLARCLKEEFDDKNPVRKNLEFFIGLRNRIEHYFEDNLLIITAPEAHACIINYENELVKRFGSKYSLGKELKFPIFIHTLRPADYEFLATIRRGVPATTLNYISSFINSLPESLASHESFAYRLALMPVKGPKTEADMALTYINANDLNEKEKLDFMGKEGSVIIAEKFRNVIYADEMLPKEIVRKVQSLIPFCFSMHDFTVLRKKWKIGPAVKNDKKGLPNSNSYCIYSPAFKRFLYTPKLVNKIVKTISSEEGYRDTLGKDPKPNTVYR